MELKKSPAASLERQRPTAFLMGMVLALALFVAAMEFHTSSEETAEGEADFEEMAADMETVPAIDPRDMVVALSQPETPLVRINPVEKETTTAEENPIEEALSNAGEDEIPAVETEQAQPTAATDAKPLMIDGQSKEVVLRIVQQYPEFPGGMVQFIKWLTDNLRYPQPAKQRNIQGTVVTTFVVNRDGTIADAKVIHGVDPLLDKEALRVLNMMPPWSPGQNEGKPCRTLVRLPIVFKI